MGMSCRAHSALLLVVLPGWDVSCGAGGLYVIEDVETSYYTMWGPLHEAIQGGPVGKPGVTTEQREHRWRASPARAHYSVNASAHMPFPAQGLYSPSIREGC